MNQVDCRSVCLQIEEAELGWTPSATVNSHLQICDSCRLFFDERMKLRQMVACLGHVQAPADFDFRLRARMAAREAKGAQRFQLAGMRFGFPTAAVAAIFMLVVGVTLFRSVQVEPPRIQPGAAVVTNPPTLNAISQERASVPVAYAASPKASTEPSLMPTRPRAQFATNQRRSRPASRDFSSVPAQVVKQDETLATVAPAFPIDSSQQSLKLSLDDGTGVYRTISVPRVSFGSQRAFGEQSSFVKSSSNGVW